MEKVYISLLCKVSLNREIFQGGIILRKISRSRIKILGGLLTRNFEDEINRYKIADETGLSLSGVHKSMGVLERGGLVEYKRIGTAPGGQPELAYRLTPRGLISVLNRSPSSWNKIDEIVPKQSIFSGISELWGDLMQPENREITIAALKKTLRMLPRFSIWEEWDDKKFKHQVQRDVFWPHTQLEDADDRTKNRWAKAVIRSQELRRRVLETIEGDIGFLSLLLGDRISCYETIRKALALERPELMAGVKIRVVERPLQFSMKELKTARRHLDELIERREKEKGGEKPEKRPHR